MFTWNFQYVSKARLGDTLNQLMLNTTSSDVLVRIHTAIHGEEEAVELARFIKEMVPRAHIFGTSTSAVINWGKIVPNQCIISITQMTDGHVRSALVPTYDKRSHRYISPERLADRIRKRVINSDTKLLLTFLTANYPHVEKLIDRSNHAFPGVQMIGGLANTADPDFMNSLEEAFVFNESGASREAVILASISGESVNCFSSYVSGAQAIGEEFEAGEGEKLKLESELKDLFPYVSSDIDDVPLRAIHTEGTGRKVKRSFIHDRKIVADNRALFRHVEDFEYAETLYAYSCVARSMIYSNCAKWELSVYENSNLCGCITGGEIAHSEGVNAFANYTFVLSVLGEAPAKQEYNPYALGYTDSLEADNRDLLEYLMEAEEQLGSKTGDPASEGLISFVRECEQKLLYTEHDDIPNAAAMNMEIKVKGYDRICMIDVPDTSSMAFAFTDQIIQLTYRNYLSKCNTYATERNYHMYLIDKWRVAIGAPSYMVSLSEFSRDMEKLQKELFESTEELIALVPIICVIDGCTAENIESIYNSARIDMMNKNVQFMVCDAGADKIDEEVIRNRYHMVNVINYAIAHDKLIPYFQGIYDNRSKTIHHYESLMRLADENGRIYYPNEFLDVARSFGLLYDSLSLKMIQKVFDRFKNITGISVSMNIGMRDIKNRTILTYIYDSLAMADHPENFVFEILENEDIEDYNALVSFVDKIHELGGLISIDDFGSGYSNLQHLLSIHMDYIKIDGSIVRHCCEDKGAESLIALISAWRDMSFEGVDIVAEFVENEQIQEKLKQYSIDYSQGYLFSKPASDILPTDIA